MAIEEEDLNMETAFPDELDVFVQGIVNGSQGITFLVTHPRANCGWCWSRTSLDGMPMNAIACEGGKDRVIGIITH
uniref:Uncharacterized protein n=1 Tax=Oryza rufipogon TaxID=4529 RepID=A0A0E0RCD1_ORYRU